MISSARAARLLALLHLVRPEEKIQNEIRSLFSLLSAEEECEFFRLSEQNSALIFTVKQMQSMKIQSPLSDEMQRKVIPALEREMKRYQKVLEILKQFHEEKIQILLLKGTALGAFLYHDPFYKRMNDFDFMIRISDLERVKIILRKMNYAPVGDLLEREKNVHSTHHLSPWVSDDLECVLGIHWNLISPKRPEQVPVEELWANAVPIQEFSDPAYRLSTAHFLMHLMLHLPPFKTGIREVADLINLAREARNEASALSQLKPLTEAWNAQAKVARALRWVRALDSESPLLEVFPVIEDDEENDFFSQKEKVLYYRTLQLSKIEKCFAKSWLSFSPYGRLSGWVQSWKEMLFPPYREAMAVLKKSDSEGIVDWFKIRVMAPVSIWRALGQEHGRVKIYLVTVINFFAVFKNLFTLLGRPLSAMKVHPMEKILEELE